MKFVKIKYTQVQNILKLLKKPFRMFHKTWQVLNHAHNWFQYKYWFERSCLMILNHNICFHIVHLSFTKDSVISWINCIFVDAVVDMCQQVN